MILYKYMSFEAAMKTVEEPSVGFSCLDDLNDPFECTAFGFEENGDVASGGTAAGACRNRFSKKYGVLSLTRQPLNSLMWSHYGDSHQGVVIGFDVDIAELSDAENCIIPSQYGEVVYTSTKPHKDLPVPDVDQLMSIGENMSFDPDAFNLVKRAFLYKSLEWGYEEEVRVVKNISHLPFSYHFSEGRHENWRKISVLGRPLYLFDIPAYSIKNIYLGQHIYKNVTRKQLVTHNELISLKEMWRDLGLRLWQCNPDISSWNLIAREVTHEKMWRIND